MTEIVKVAEDSARGGFFLTLGNSISMVISSVFVFVAARFLGPEQYGLYSISTIIPSLLILTANPGVDQGLMRHISNMNANRQEHYIPKLILHGLSFKTTLGLIASAFCFFFSDPLANIVNRPETSFYIKIGSATILFQTLYTAINSTMIGLDKTEYNALATSTHAAAKAAIASSLVILGLGVLGALSGHILGYAAGSLVGLCLLRKAYRYLHHSNPGSDISFLSNVALLVRYGLPLYLSVFLQSFITQYRNVLLALFTSNIDVGNFNAALNFTILIGTVTTSITPILLTAFSKLDIGEARRFFTLSTKFASLLVIPLVTLTIVYSQELVWVVYGENYATASYFLSLSVLQHYLIGLGSAILVSLFNGLGDTKTTLKIFLVNSATFILIAPPITWFLKTPGTIIASLTSAILATLYGLHAANSKLQAQIEPKSTTRIFLAALLAAMPLIPLQLVPTLNGPTRLAIGAPLYLSTYLILAPTLRAITKPELTVARTILNRIRPLRILTKPIFSLQEAILTRIQQ